MENTFFGDVGLSSTSANHIANKAKEYYTQILNDLTGLELIETKLSIIGHDDKITSSFATKDAFNSIPENLKEVAECNSLIAWLREAIKEKERLSVQARAYVDPERIELNDKRPTREELLTREDVINSLSVNDRARYYELEAIASTIGKFIHPTGSLANARKRYYNALKRPISVEKNGLDTIIEYYSPAVTKEELEKMFFDLQAKHREVEAELNSIKHTIDQTLSKDMQEKTNKYSKAFDEWRREMDSLIIKEESIRSKKEEEIENLKIIIPNRLKKIYDKVNKL